MILSDDAIAMAKYRYSDDPYVRVEDSPFDDVWMVEGGYMVRAAIFVPALREDDDES